MHIPEILVKKRQGIELTAHELTALFAGYLNGEVPDYQMSALLMAICCSGMSESETDTLFELMLHSGDQVDLSHIAKPKVDKHSTGGIGDKVSLSLAPIAAAMGLCVPMIAGRGLGHTGGTLDKLESCPGFNTQLSLERFQSQLADIGGAIIGQTETLVPLDKRLYALRDVTGTVESIPLIACSIMSKKVASGLDALLLDVKVGNGAFMSDIEQARLLSHEMIRLGRQHGKKVVVYLTQMSQPLGVTIGNALEFVEATLMLKGEASQDYASLTCAFAAEMAVLGGLASDEKAAMALVDQALRSGAALEKWRQIVIAQGGDVRWVDTPENLLNAPVKQAVIAREAGIIQQMHTRDIGLLAAQMGAGRLKQDSVIDPAVGFEFGVKVGDRIAVGDEIGVIHARSAEVATHFATQLLATLEIGPEECSALPLVIERIG